MLILRLLNSRNMARPILDLSVAVPFQGPEPEVRRQLNAVSAEIRQNGVGRRIDQHARLFSDDIGHELNDFINVGAVVNAHHDGRTSRTQQVRGIANAAGDEILVRDNRYAAS